MTTLLMICFVIAAVLGGAILGWLARARQFGLTDDTSPVEMGEPDGLHNGD